MKNQVLSIEQIFKLQNLGFNVVENSSSIVIIEENGPFIVNKEMIEKNVFGITDKIQDMFYSMTIKIYTMHFLIEYYINLIMV